MLEGRFDLQIKAAGATGYSTQVLSDLNLSAGSSEVTSDMDLEPSFFTLKDGEMGGVRQDRHRISFQGQHAYGPRGS